MHTILLQASGFAPEWLQKVGILSLMAVAVNYLYKQLQNQSTELKALRDKHEADMIASNANMQAYMKDDREIMLKALNNNTEVMKDNIVMMGKIKDHLNAGK